MMHALETTPKRRFAAALVIACAACALLIAAIAFYLPAKAIASQTDSETVRVGYYENEVFEEGAQEGAVKTGYAYEYYRKLSEYTGWTYDYVYGDFSELYQRLLDGEIDLLAGLAYKEDRAGLIGYPDTAMGQESYNLVKHASDHSVTTDPSTLSGKKIGVLDSALVGVLNEYLSAHDVQADIESFSDYETLFASFDNGSVDILAAEGDGAYGRDDAEVISSFGSSDYYLCVNINRPDMLSELNEAQAELLVDEPNYSNSLRSKYYSSSVSSRAFSLDETEWMRSNDSLTVGYLNNYLPYSDTDEQGNVSGIVKDLVPKILDSLRITDVAVTYRSYDSYEKLIAAMNASDIDVAFPVGGGLYYSEENGIYQSNPVISTSMELVYAGDYDDGKTSHFAVNENNLMQYYYIKTYFPDAEITFFPSIDACLKAVIDGKTSCTTLNGLRANEILKNKQYDNLAIRPLSHGDDRCFGVRIGDEDLLKLLNRGINIVGEDYALSLAYHYTKGLYTYGVVDFILDNIFLVILAILVIATLVIILLVRDSNRSKKQMRDQEIARQELEEKNRELAESEAALSNALAAAEHASRAKTTFLNNMSHDIRTPMNAIVGFTALAASHIDNKEQVSEYLTKISISSQHLLSLINDVLDMSRIESGNVKIEEAETHLPDVIHDLRTIIQANVTAKQQELFVDTLDVVNEDVITDKLRLSQILLNILSNAIKFTPVGGTITFRVIEKPASRTGYAHFEFRIKDNGIGMSEEFQKDIFDAFTREQTSTVSGMQGTGLGMAITKNIVDMMGGTIAVTSTEGKGSEFVVNLEFKICGTAMKYERLSELQGLRALVVDDDADTCLSVCSMLREIGMRPDWTNYGKEAVIRAKDAYDNADAFSTFIIDWIMPDMNGIETVRRIRREVGDSASIIILTAYDWSDIEQEARDAGVTAFCSKPIFMSELRDVLSRPFRVESSPAADESTLDFAGTNVLLVEDNELNQEIALMMLEEAGFVVDVASDGTEAVEIMSSVPAGRYDIILMDIQMPRMNGYEAARRIRALDDSEKARIPIVAITANAFEEDKKDAFEAGMNGHLAKPYELSEMTQAIADALA